MKIELLKFFAYSVLIVLISKYLLDTTIRKMGKRLNLNIETIGSVAGYATSMPELLASVFASFNGLITTSVYNILGSNAINLIIFIWSLVINKNFDSLKTTGLRMSVGLIVLTILIPFIIIGLNIQPSFLSAIIFLILFALFRRVSQNINKLYFKGEIELKNELRKLRTKTAVYYSTILALIGIALFIIGDRLGETMSSLALDFNISQVVIGILLGFITSIPEFITFSSSQKHHNKGYEDKTEGVIEATNNLLTSNMANLFLILPIAELIFLCFT